MTAKRWNGASQTDLTVFKRWNGSAFVDITTGSRWNGTSWDSLGIGSADLSATSSASSVSGVVFNSSPSAPPAASVTSNPVTVTATGGGGAGPTYSWTLLSGNSGIEPTVPTGATTSFTGLVYTQDTITATFRCTITRGVEVVTVDVDVSLRYFGGTA